MTTSTRRGAGEGSLFWNDKRQRWVGLIDLPTSDGRRRRSTVSAKSKTEARDQLRKLQRDNTAGLSQPDGKLTDAGFLEDWFESVLPSQQGVREEVTIDNHRWAIDIVKVALGNKTLMALTADDVDDLLHGMAAKGYAKSSMTRVRSVLSRALRHAERRGKVVRNVASSDLVDTPPGPKRQPRSLTPERRKRCWPPSKATSSRP
ncbi:MAG: hypothetical protein H0W70_09870 [Actinobacteria bacterium]|nr:hypothetical protein [Actinomycetota bacterium]